MISQKTHGYSFFTLYKKIRQEQDLQFVQILKNVISHKNRLATEMYDRIQNRILSLRNIEIVVGKKIDSNIYGNYFSDHTLANQTAPASTTRFDRENTARQLTQVSLPGMTRNPIPTATRPSITGRSFSPNNPDENFDSLAAKKRVGGIDSHRTKMMNDEAMLKDIEKKEGVRILDRYIDLLSKNSRNADGHSVLAKHPPDQGVYSHTGVATGKDLRPPLENESRRTQSQNPHDESMPPLSSETRHGLVSNDRATGRSASTPTGSGEMAATDAVTRRFQNKSLSDPTKFNSASSTGKGFPSAELNVSAPPSSTRLHGAFKQFKGHHDTMRKNNRMRIPGTVESVEFDAILDFSLKSLKKLNQMEDIFSNPHTIPTFKQFLSKIGFVAPPVRNHLEVLLLRMLIRELYFQYIFRIFIAKKRLWENKLKRRISARIGNDHPGIQKKNAPRF